MFYHYQLVQKRQRETLIHKCGSWDKDFKEKYKRERESGKKFNCRGRETLSNQMLSWIERK